MDIVPERIVTTDNAIKIIYRAKDWSPSFIVFPKSEIRSIMGGKEPVLRTTHGGSFLLLLKKDEREKTASAIADWLMTGTTFDIALSDITFSG